MQKTYKVHWLNQGTDKTICGEDVATGLVFTFENIYRVTCLYCRIGVETNYQTSEMVVDE